MSLSNIRIVLVRTFHPGNIGSAARSMKTMGLNSLHLVNPKEFPSPEANKMAAGALDVLENARVYDSLEEAIADCTVVVACTARPRGYDLPTLLPEEAAVSLNSALAKYRLTIPANPDYSSLNMAAAVQTLSYEIFKTAQTVTAPIAPMRDLPSSENMERLYSHLETVLKEISFLRPHQGETMQRIRQLVTRAEPDNLELNILRGILSAIERYAKKD